MSPSRGAQGQLTSTSHGDQGYLGFLIFDSELIFSLVLLQLLNSAAQLPYFGTHFKKTWSNLCQVYEAPLPATLALFSAVLEEGVLVWALR